MIEIHLPYPPSANRLWRRANTGMRRSEEYLAWLVEAGWEAKRQRPGKIEGPYKLSIHAVRPDRRRRDLDNLFKSTCDLLQSLGIIKDDSQAEMISARWVTSGSGITVILEKAGVE